MQSVKDVDLQKHGLNERQQPNKRGGQKMLFSVSAQWTPAVVNALIQNPTDRSAAARQIAEAAGARLVAWYGTGGGDRQGFLVIVDVPDGLTIQAIYNAGHGTGAYQGIRIQRLYTAEEMIEAFRKAQTIQKAYTPPGG
jgi:uncharacterized protein with GYD domain